MRPQSGGLVQRFLRSHLSKNVAEPGIPNNVDELALGEFDQFGFPIPAGHGTHVAGIIAAASSDPTDTFGPNPTAAGTAGVCWRCSLIVSKIRSGPEQGISFANIAAGIVHAINAGAQVINMSFGGQQVEENGVLKRIPAYCNGKGYVNGQAALCAALHNAELFGVVVVGASGNANYTDQVQFPASNYYSIAVAGIGSTGQLWHQNDTYHLSPDGFPVSWGSDVGGSMISRGLKAPARDVLSTVYANKDWNAGARCGDAPGWTIGNVYLPGSQAGIGFGTCTGTSMAAPHVSGIVGLMRSIDPLAAPSRVRSQLLSTASQSQYPTSTDGFGVPNASSAVNSVLLDNPKRLTPLMALRSGNRWFYSVVPQMIRAARNNTLPPVTTGSILLWQHQGNTFTLPGSSTSYTAPGDTAPARAEVWVYSTFKPQNQSVQLAPLYRMSKAVGAPVADYFYATSYAEVLTRQSQGYSYDGIEGYVYPTAAGTPPGSVRLKRASRSPSQSGEFAVYPESNEASMQAQGYIYGTTTLGWAFPNTGTRPTY